MKKYDLVSNYTLKLAKKQRKSAVNEDNVSNIVNREFGGRKPLEVVVSDLTYVKVAVIVKSAFFSVQTDLRRISLFHTDRGSEFKNEVIEGIISAFGIRRSLSAKGTPVDNAVVESMYSVIKTEFAFNREFSSLDELELQRAFLVSALKTDKLQNMIGQAGLFETNRLLCVTAQKPAEINRGFCRTV